MTAAATSNPKMCCPGVAYSSWAARGTAAVACGAFRPIQPDIAEIKRMFVIPECRSRGYSRAMLTELERRADQNGYKTGGWRQVTGSRKQSACTRARVTGESRTSASTGIRKAASASKNSWEVSELAMRPATGAEKPVLRCGRHCGRPSGALRGAGFGHRRARMG